MKTIRIDMPTCVREIIEVLENAGFEAFAVGGCVRDAVLGQSLQTGILQPLLCRKK